MARENIKIMLDVSPDNLTALSEKHDFEFWQLRTPLTNYRLSGVPYGLDNGCFSQFRRKAWERLLNDAESNRPVFVCLPDIVGDAARTLDLFECFKHKTAGLPRALVLQDGIGNHRIPFNDIQAVFIGGSDSFKNSGEAFAAAKAAKYLDKWVHVGRVNTVRRLSEWKDYADSIDGTGLIKDGGKLKAVVDYIKNDTKQNDLFIGAA